MPRQEVLTDACTEAEQACLALQEQAEGGTAPLLSADAAAACAHKTTQKAATALLQAVLEDCSGATMMQQELMVLTAMILSPGW